MSSVDLFEYRKGTTSDLSELSRLLRQLGYRVSADELRERWALWTHAGNTAVVAVRTDGSLAGMVTFNMMPVLYRAAPVGRVSALVVDKAERGAGIGLVLAQLAESMLAQAGCGILEVTSNIQRLTAHQFYEHIGYTCDSLRFSKVLLPYELLATRH